MILHLFDRRAEHTLRFGGIDPLYPSGECDGCGHPKRWVAKHAGPRVGTAKACDPGRLLAALDLSEPGSHGNACLKHWIVSCAGESLRLVEYLHRLRTVTDRQ